LNPGHEPRATSRYRSRIAESLVAKYQVRISPGAESAPGAARIRELRRGYGYGIAIRIRVRTAIQRFEDSRIQRFEDSRIRGFRDSRIRGFEDSRIQRFEDSRIRGFEDSGISD
jgi:hypothetical protein